MAYKKSQREQFLKLLESHGGNVSKTVAAFRIKHKNFERVTWYDWLKKDPFVKQCHDDLIEKEIDDAEELHKAHRNGIPILDETNSIIGWTLKPSREAVEFFLKTKGRNRGYGDRSETLTVPVNVLPYELPEPNYDKLEAYKKSEEAAIANYFKENGRG